MEIKNYFAQDAQGNIMPSANCYLYLPGTTTLATGLVDGNGTPISNPFLASSAGQVEFGAPNGVYDLRVALGARDWTIKVQCADIVQAMDVMDSILGSHAENPTTRNNGNPLEPGDETWNSTDKQPYWWNGSVWVALNSSAQQLEARIRDATSPENGAGMEGFDAGLDYPINTIGSAIASIDAKSLGILSDGTDETAKLQAIANKFKGTGKTLRLSKGTIRITSPIIVDGFIFSLADFAQIEVYGDVVTPFMNGAIILTGNGVFQGGILYTNGAMLAALGSKLIRQVSGRVYGVTLYCQLDEAVNHTAGYLDVTIYGSVSRGVRSQPTADISLTYNVRWYNQGIRFVNKLVVDGTPIDSRAVHVYPQTAITKPIRVNVGSGSYSWKNGVWVGGGLFPASDVIVTCNVTKSGFYINKDGVEVAGHGAGTSITLENCPDGRVLDCVTRQPRGYNIAIISGSHGAQLIGGTQQGGGGDPVAVVTGADNVIIGGKLLGGTVGVSVGEAGATNNTRITADISNMSAAPITCNKGSKCHFTGTINGEANLASYVGNWTGPGKPKGAMLIFSDFNDVTYSPSSVQGFFTHDVIDRSGINGRLRVNRSGVPPIAPIIKRKDIAYNKFSRDQVGASFVRMIDEDTTGYNGVGEFSLPASGPAFSSMAVSADMVNMADFDISGTDLATIWSNYAVVVYMKYVAGVDQNRVNFSLQQSTVTPSTAELFYGNWGDPLTVVPGDNNIMGKYRKMVEGEWYPIVMPLNRVIWSGANPANVPRFMVWKTTNPTAYDLTITKPVLVYIGTPPR